MIAQFLEYLFVERNYKPRTLRGYKTALADYFAPNVIDIKNDQSLLRLLS